MYIFRGTEPEEPVLSSGYICKFRNLQITAVLLDDIIPTPEKQNRDLLIVFETKCFAIRELCFEMSRFRMHINLLRITAIRDFGC